MLTCPRCGEEYPTHDPFTGIYYCKKCGYQGTLVVTKDEE